jgi:hypothetical protein
MNDNNLGLPDKSNPNEPTSPQQPIFLPAPQEQYIPSQQQSPSSQWIPPQGMGNRPQPTNPATGPGRSWKNDPVYRILFIAIGVVLLSTLTCVVVLAAMYNEPSPQNAQKGEQNTQKTAVVNISIPTPTPEPTPTPTPEPTPTPIPVAGPLTVEITNIPQQVQDGRNGTTVSVDVTSNPGVTAFLSITYTIGGVPFSSTRTQSENTNDQGNATLSWKVQAFPRGTTVTAQVTATAQDNQGNQAKSKTVKVTINSN